MLSRVADNIYWFGRYLQRAECTARLVNVNGLLLLDLPPGIGVTFGWRPLIDIVGATHDYPQHYDDFEEINVVRYLTVDGRNDGSILTSLEHAREILRTVRDSVPREVWERINALHYYVLDQAEHVLSRSRRQEFLSKVIEGVMLVSGVLNCNMSRDVGYHFLRIGTHLEQADMTTRILDVRSTSVIDTGYRGEEQLAPFYNIQWMSVLRSLTAYQMYRRHERHRVNRTGVLRFLLQNREFPRSAAYCLATVASTLPFLPQNRNVERTLWRIRSLIQDANIDKLVETGLHGLIDEAQIGLADLHESLSQADFRPE